MSEHVQNKVHNSQIEPEQIRDHTINLKGTI